MYLVIETVCYVKESGALLQPANCICVTLEAAEQICEEVLANSLDSYKAR